MEFFTVMAFLVSKNIVLTTMDKGQKAENNYTCPLSQMIFVILSCSIKAVCVGFVSAPLSLSLLFTQHHSHDKN